MKKVSKFLGRISLYATVALTLLLIVVSMVGGSTYSDRRYVESQVPVLVNERFQEILGSRVYKITSPTNQRTGGTGFAAVARSGKTVIVTNHHICELADKDGFLMIHTEDGVKALSQILYNSPIEDLCVVNSLPGVEGLKVGNFAEPTTYVVVLGHPYLEPLTASGGVIIGYETMNVGEIKRDACNGFGEHVEVGYMFGIFKTKYCLKTLLAMSLSNRIYPGNSGSPVLNMKGEVVGVVFAGDTRTAQGFAMTLYALADLLDRF